jgi:uncharacterized membrane protein
MFEEMHSLLWTVCGVFFTLPVVAMVTYFFWSKQVRKAGKGEVGGMDKDSE